MDAEKTNVNLEQILGVLRRHVWLISLCCLVVAGAAFGFSRIQPAKYTATAELIFNGNQQAAVTGLAAGNSNDQQAEQNTNVQLVQLGEVAEKTAAALGGGLTKQAVKADVSVGGKGESNLVDVSATSKSPKIAAEIATTYAAQFVSVQQKATHEYYTAALAAIDKQLAQGASIALQERAASLQLLAELPTNVRVAQVASVPTSPSSPKTSRNTLLGAFLGLLFGVGLAFVIERADPRIQRPTDLEEIYGLSLLGVVPESSALSPLTPIEGRGWSALPPGEAEVFKLIRAHLRSFNGDRQPHTILVASAAPGDGKSTVAAQLAAATASVGSRVLLLEADLRQPVLARRFDIRPTPGLSDVVDGSVSTDAATQSIEVQLRPGGSETRRTLDVLVAGQPLPPNPVELIEGSGMDDLLEFAKSAYDLVVIDTPPLDVVSDAFALLGKVDGVIVVGWVGRTSRNVSERLHQTLTASGVPLLGVIANGARHGTAGYYGAQDYIIRDESAPSAPSRSSWAVRDEGVQPSGEVL